MARLVQGLSVMKTIGLLFGVICVLSGCGDKNIVDPPLDDDMSTNAQCGSGCEGGCGTNARCFGGGSVAALYSFAQRCAKICTTSDDCATGQICVRAAGETGGAVCLVPQEPPASCGHVDCFAILVNSCVDTNVLSRPATDWCGSELVHCAHGCSEQANVDAGFATPDAGAKNAAGCLPPPA